MSKETANFEIMSFIHVLSFPAHGPKRAYVALCALYPVCAELFLPYESSADRRPAKPKPLAYMLRVYRDRETDRNIPFSVLLPHLATRQIQPGYRPLKRHFYNKTVSPPRSHTVCEGDAWITSEVYRPSTYFWRSSSRTSSPIS